MSVSMSVAGGRDTYPVVSTDDGDGSHSSSVSVTVVRFDIRELVSTGADSPDEVTTNG